MKQKENWHLLIAKYQAAQLSDEEFVVLEEGLRNSEELRALFHRAARVDSALRLESEQKGRPAQEEKSVIPFRKRPVFGGLAAVATIAILSALSITIASQRRIVATLVSSENAAWESSLPTVEGARLSRGSLRLSTGIATIQFDSGVDLTLEAPARVFIKGPKRAILVHGTVVISAADEADEFMLETGYGQAVSKQAECIISVGKTDGNDRFEMLSGEVWVSHDTTREAVKLESGETATLSSQGLHSSEGYVEEEAFEVFNRGLRLPSEKRSATFIRNNHPQKWTRPEFLTLKKSIHGNSFDQYCVVSFDLGVLDPGEIQVATLRLNLVPSGMGLASRLPKLNRFAVYGLVNPDKENWSNTDPWEIAPGPGDGKPVGGFEIPRSQQSGTIEIAGDELLALVKEKAGSSVSFIIVRETAHVEGQGRGLTHAIASASHPESAGPVLEISMK
ncbi:MAG: hypothetical protein P1U68_03260 [Verrucomicrobiales bacterium]|nr:hypothetical protein [Verrucomicrobiales bacterium]